MSTIQEVFLETELGEIEAQQARDNRASELQAQGWLCTTETLYTVWGYRVFYLEAAQPEATPASSKHHSRRPPLLRARPRLEVEAPSAATSNQDYSPSSDPHPERLPPRHRQRGSRVNPDETR